MTGRRPHRDRPVKWNISLPTSLANDVTQFLADPFLGTPLRGDRSKLIETLLRKHLRENAVQPLATTQEN
jgi:hypothetical protein